MMSANQAGEGITRCDVPFINAKGLLPVSKPHKEQSAVRLTSLPVTAVLGRRGRLAEHVELHRFPRPQ